MACRFCGKPTDLPDAACDECKKQIIAARNAREVMEQRIAVLEDKLEFVMNFFRPAFPSSIVGAPPTIMTLGAYYEKRKLEAEARTASEENGLPPQQTGLITNA